MSWPSLLTKKPVVFLGGIALGWYVSTRYMHAYYALRALDALRLHEHQTGAGAEEKARTPGTAPKARKPYTNYNKSDAPRWLQGLFTCPSQQRVVLREWEDSTWRAANGWKGRDLCHDPDGKAVQVKAYFWSPGTKCLTGIVEFGPAAESHRGMCHGGAMTSLMDDLLGHIAFLGGPAPCRPWYGATVQVNCKLMKPVRVGEVLKVEGTVDAVDGKKVRVSAKLLGEGGDVHAELSGLSIAQVWLSPVEDKVRNREWKVVEGTEGGRKLKCDSGWWL